MTTSNDWLTEWGLIVAAIILVAIAADMGGQVGGALLLVIVTGIALSAYQKGKI